jgi:hypothetical protein
MKNINHHSFLRKQNAHNGNFSLKLLQWIGLLLVAFGNNIKNGFTFFKKKFSGEEENKSTIIHNFLKQKIMTPQYKFLKWSFLLVLFFSGVNAFAQNPYPTTGDHQVCINATEPYGVELHAGSTYAWTVTPLAGGNGTITAGATPNLITVTWTTLGTATMQVIETNSFGCVGDPVTIIVTVNPKPNLVITNPLAVCAPSTVNITLPAITLGSTSGITLTYWTNAAATIPYLTPTAATQGTYFIKATTTASGCFDIKPVTVTVNPLPTLVVTNPPSVCSPNTVDITATGVTTGSTTGLTLTYWTDAAATISFTTATTATAGTYFIKGTTAAGCADIKPVTVTVNPLLAPTVNCGTSTTNSVAFTWAAVVGATGYNVSYTINGGAASATTPIGNVLTYAVTGLAGGNTVVITVTPTGVGCFTPGIQSCIATACNPPTVNINYPSTPYCTSITTAQPINRNGTGTFTGGTYSSTPAGLSIDVNSGAIIPSASTAGPYVVTYTIAATGGCPAVTATTSVTINPQVTPTFDPVAAICNGGTLNALPTTSLNGITGTWSPALSNTAIGNTVYTFTPTAGLCATTTPLTITVNPILVPTVNCGTSTTNSVSFTWAAVGAASGYNVSYTINGGAANNIGAIGNVLTYNVTGLSGGDNVTITVTPTGVGCFAAAAPKTCTATPCTPATASIGYIGSPFCISNTVAQSVSFSGTSGGTYSSTPAGLSIDPNTGSITPSTSTPNIYTVTYTIAASGGCSAFTTNAPVVITSLVVPTFNNVAAICSGGTLTALPTTSLNGVTGTWSPALSNTTIGNTTYTFTPTAGQCATGTNLTITVNPLPTPVVSGPAPVCQTIGTNYSTYSTPNVAGHTYTWTVLGGTIIAGQGTNSITVNWTTIGGGTVSVSETITATTCSASNVKNVTVNPKPITTPISHN